MNRPEPQARPDAAAALDFGDPLAGRAGDDTDRGWGERPGTTGDAAADLARFLDEKPPHHL
ncbi:hypothetical protein V1J52_15135 [Streptomyces sp. TRM 70351]|uniref:hypothetical protein n=1 Tax=Streptomyces sp. TRM 70351 TaxID=3116552 RepID=UPI002E7BD672|nr:hypothetical protein [Streptomyces sp. TRM 70351]MEE1929501.1 hypothetical protein [Streptomyces sp. TRM 70351]